ncbi:MAG: aminomethyl transferase family protein [Deltaproteobacteria bacterium]|nr:MAG: aminomethyl transferase family protein [Deltaproteobacteria bacterium]
MELLPELKGVALNQTPLNHWHKKNDAHMSVFSGYEMPLWYPAGTRAEHLSVITHAGIFDTSHMASIWINGPDAFHLLQYAFSRDLDRWNGKAGSPLPEGRCVYGVFLNHDGEVIDDTVVYRFGKDSFMVVVNAGMGGTITGHLERCRDNMNVEIRNLTGRIGKMDIQGPLSAKVLAKVLTDPEGILGKMVYFSFKGSGPFSSHGETVKLINGIPAMVSRTGYTGEFGFELFVRSEDLLQTWELILESGRNFNIQACGLAARDSLRTGAVLPLSHQDIGTWPYVRHPWLLSLPFNPGQTSFSKHFIGENVLLFEKEAEYTYPFAGFDPRKIMTEKATVTDLDGKPIGSVLTCTTDMAISRQGEGDRIYSIATPDKPVDFHPKGLSCGFVKVAGLLQPGTVVYLEDGRRKIKVRIENDIRPDRTARCAMGKMLFV